MQEQASDVSCFFLLSQLSEPGRLGTALSGPASRRASAMTFSGCDTSPMVDCCSFSICRTQTRPEEIGRVGERSLGSGWTARLSCGDTDFFFFFFFKCSSYAEERTRERGETKFSAGVTVTAPTTMHAEERQQSVPRDVQKCEQEDWAAVSGSERIAPYRLDQSRVEAYTTGFSQTSIFIPTPFSGRTNGAQWRQGESKFLPLFFVAWTQRRLTECFPWATEGPIPPKETLTFKKEFFWQTTSGSLPAGLKKKKRRNKNTFQRLTCVVSKYPRMCWRRIFISLMNSFSVWINSSLMFFRCFRFLSDSSILSSLLDSATEKRWQEQQEKEANVNLNRVVGKKSWKLSTHYVEHLLICFILELQA